MPPTQTAPVEDSVAKVGDELAVGEDLEFQRKWWRFEKIVWIVFLIIVLLDLAGVFGRGPVASVHRRSSNHLMLIDYERIQRFSTPSIMTIHFDPAAVKDGKIQLWVSDSLVKELGNQRIVPQPISSVIGNGGILYTFGSSPLPDSIGFALQPSNPGIWHFQMHIPGATLEDPPLDQFQTKVVVVP